jgi:hypothetical protein
MAYQPAAPFTVPQTGSVDQRLRLVAAAISKKADQTLEPVYNAVLLTAPGGSVWRMTVGDDGIVSIAVVPR